MSGPTPGAIVSVLRDAGIAVEDGREKFAIRCPLPGHDDAKPSAFVNVERNIFGCSVCTGGAWKRYLKADPLDD